MPPHGEASARGSAAGPRFQSQHAASQRADTRGFSHTVGRCRHTGNHPIERSPLIAVMASTCPLIGPLYSVHLTRRLMPPHGGAPDRVAAGDG